MNFVKKLESLKSGQSVIIVTSEGKYFKVASIVLDYMTKKKKLSGVYISISNPYEKIFKEISGADWDRILFLDGISKTLGKEKSSYKNCVLLQGPTSLTEIGLCISSAVSKGEINFVIVDSVSSILTYNNEKTALRFVQYMVSKSKSLKMIGIVVADTKDEEKAVIRAVKDISDVIIRF